MTKWTWYGESVCGCVVCLGSALLGGAFEPTAMAQEGNVLPLERAAAAEVRRREAESGVERGGLDRVPRAVNGELTDVARALRRLDQSYYVRGFQGCGAATAGSVFVDWRARGIRPQDRVIVLPPEPIVLGRPKAACCSAPCPMCGQTHFGKTGCECGRAIVPPAPTQPTGPCCHGLTSPTPVLTPTPAPLESLPPTPVR